MDDQLTYPACYDMDGVPVRQMAAEALPQRLTKQGRWVPFNDPAAFYTRAHRVDPADFGESCRVYAGTRMRMRPGDF